MGRPRDMKEGLTRPDVAFSPWLSKKETLSRVGVTAGRNEGMEGVARKEIVGNPQASVARKGRDVSPH